MIVPTNGRVMWYHPKNQLGVIQHDPEKPLTALVTHVWNDNMVNLAVFDSTGVLHQRTSVPIVQDGSPAIGNNSPYAEWMPYQKGQAAKYEALEKEKANV